MKSIIRTEIKCNRNVMYAVADKTCFRFVVTLCIVFPCRCMSTPGVTDLACIQMDQADQQCRRDYWTICDGRLKKHEIKTSKSNVCAPGFIFRNRSNLCFKLIHVDSFRNVAEKCSKLGKGVGLPVFDWGQKYQDIKSYLKQNIEIQDRSVFIGAQRVQGKYRWPDGREMKNAPWCPNQPDGNETFITLYGAKGFCVDDNDGKPGKWNLAAICEFFL